LVERRHGHPIKLRGEVLAFVLDYYVQFSSRDKRKDHVGPEMELLVWLLAYVHKPLEELTRDDFDTFWQAYHEW
jgi:hypothetical protein